MQHTRDESANYLNFRRQLPAPLQVRATHQQKTQGVDCRRHQRHSNDHCHVPNMQQADVRSIRMRMHFQKDKSTRRQSSVYSAPTLRYKFTANFIMEINPARSTGQQYVEFCLRTETPAAA